MASESQNPPTDFYDPYMSIPLPMSQNRDAHRDAQALMWQLETDNLSARIELNLLNQVIEQDQVTGEYKRVQKDDPLMNEKGVQAVLTLIRPHTDKNTILSNLTDFEIGLTMVEIRSKLALMLGRNYELFGAKKDKLPIITTIVINPIWASYKRAANETTLAYLGKTQQIQEIRRTEEGDRGGFIQNLLNPFQKQNRH